MSYQDSHSSPGYGELYERTYREGYYRAQWERIERPLLRRLLAVTHAEGARTTLDFACGTGRILAEHEAFFPDTWGVDVSEAMVTRARDRCAQSHIVLQDLTVAPLPVSFDVITAFRFFLNAEPELRTSVVAALWRHCNPGGRLIANIHVNRNSPLGIAYRLRNRLGVGTYANTLGLRPFIEILSEGGFRVDVVHWYSFLPRLGWAAPWMATTLLGPTDRLASALPQPLQGWSQAFLVVARRM